MDRCKCWTTTTVVITIEHCPSAISEIVKEMDRVVEFGNKATSLNRFGKFRIGAIETISSPAVGEK